MEQHPTLSPLHDRVMQARLLTPLPDLGGYPMWIGQLLSCFSIIKEGCMYEVATLELSSAYMEVCLVSLCSTFIIISMITQYLAKIVVVADILVKIQHEELRYSILSKSKLGICHLPNLPLSNCQALLIDIEGLKSHRSQPLERQNVLTLGTMVIMLLLQLPMLVLFKVLGRQHIKEALAHADDVVDVVWTQGHTSVVAD